MTSRVLSVLQVGTPYGSIALQGEHIFKPTRGAHFVNNPCQNPATKQHDLSSVRFVMSGAAPLSAELTEQLVKVLPDASIGQAYGMTESSTALTFPRLDMKICTLGSSGRLLPGVTAKVIKDDGTLAGFDEQGELYVKAPSLAVGYYKNPEA